MKKIFLCTLCLMCVCTGYAQKKGSVSGRVATMVKRDDIAPGFKGMERLVGATVSLVTIQKDTIYRTTNSEGIFEYKEVPQGRAVLEISFVGYKTKVDTIDVGRSTLLPYLVLEEEAKKIDEVVVKGKVPLMSQSGDTVIYNAAAVPVLEDDDAIRIIEQLPGMEVSAEGGVKAHGEGVARSYVNGKLIFGDNSSSALRNLLAKEVVKIKVYDEPTDSDRRRGITKGKPQKVIDIVTRNPIVSSVVGHFLASAGADIDKGSNDERRFRYGVGATANFFSEMLLMSVNAFGNNIGRTSNRVDELMMSQRPQNSYTEDIYVDVGIERFWKDRMDGPSLKGGYRYTDKASESMSVSRRRYFETESNPEMIYSDTTLSNDSRSTHEAYANIDLHGVKSKFLNKFSLNNEFTYKSGEDFSMNNTNILKEAGADYSSTSQRNFSDGYTIREILSWGDYFSRRSLRFSFIADISDNNGSGWRIDSLASTANKKVLESTSGDFSQSYGWSVGIPLLSPPKKEEGEAQDQNSTDYMLSLEYNGSYEDLRTHKLSINLDGLENPVDTANTMNYTYTYLKHKVGLGFFRGGGKSWVVIADAGLEYSRPCKNEFFPEDYTYRKNFLTPSARLAVSRSKSGSGVNFSVSMDSSLPSLEQITARIDDKNPLFLTAGNPNLKPSQSYSFSTGWNKMLGLTGQMNILMGSVSYTRNAMTTRSRYFSQATELPDWENYVTQPNATLSTYENVSGLVNAQLMEMFSYRFGKSGTLTTTASGNYSRGLAYVGDELSVTNAYVASVRLGWRGTVSRKFRYSVSPNISYSFSENSVRNASRYLSWGASGTLDYNPFKWLFGKVNYGYSAQRFYTKTGTDRSSHMLNAVAGVKFFKSLCSLSVSVCDILNKTSSFTSSMQANYVLDSWRPTFGRYWLVNFGVKFNRNQTQKKYRGQLHDGSTNQGGVIFMGDGVSAGGVIVM